MVTERDVTLGRSTALKSTSCLMDPMDSPFSRKTEVQVTMSLKTETAHFTICGISFPAVLIGVYKDFTYMTCDACACRLSVFCGTNCIGPSRAMGLNMTIPPHHDSAALRCDHVTDMKGPGTSYHNT